ncbi:MAG: hypothetical protein MRY79_01605 [Alphaproteobacteria bacterium]|nr:hypothetical protein [Alphaproteobacteria bacterium]
MEGRKEFCRRKAPHNKVWLYFSQVAHDAAGGEGTYEVEIDGVKKQFNFWGTQFATSTKPKPDSVLEVIDVSAPDNPDSYELVGSVTTEEADKMNLRWWSTHLTA